MPTFREYMHVEKFDNDPVLGIEIGECYVFPKLDGSNASAWFLPDSGIIMGGSRHRELTFDADNQGFYSTICNQESLLKLFAKYPHFTLYGEWMVPHTLKTYREDVWRKFWVFDVFNNDTLEYLHYETYKPLLEEAGVDYVPPLAIVKAGNIEQFTKCLSNNILFIQDGAGTGEGIVIKNYDFKNKDGDTIWAKIIASDFKEKHHKAMGPPEIGGVLDEEQIATTFVTEALVTKNYAKIKNDKNGWKSEYIPELLGRVWYDVINEEMWNILKDKKYKVINFPVLQRMVTKVVKQKLPEVFT